MSRAPRVLLAASLAVWAAHAALLGDWLVDDAGISFAYARNLARGAGLVAQAGAPPVEGFSNPLWTLLLAALVRAGLFHPVWTPKLLSFGLVGAAFAMVVQSAPGRGARAWLVGASPLLLALNTSFVVWTASGLENPMYALLAAASATASLRFGGSARLSSSVGAGAIAGLLALTRPEGAVYGWALLGLAAAFAARNRGARARHAAVLAAAALVVAGPYLALRRLYFGDWLPNTYYAKYHGGAGDPLRLLELPASAAGALAPLLLAAVGGLLLRAIARRSREDQQLWVLAVHLAAATLAFLWLPPDWMGEYRFATPFFLFLYWLSGHALGSLIDDFAPARRRLLAPAALLLVLAETARVHAGRSLAFSQAPTVPFQRIAEFGRGYDALAALLPAASASLLLPDLGGTLYEVRRLRLIDLAGLCDRTVARTLTRDTPRFHDYLFDGVRPTFIHVHASWAGWAALHSDARFPRDYVPLHEDWSGGVNGEPRVGDYVRRDAAADQATLSDLRAAFFRLGLARPLP